MVGPVSPLAPPGGFPDLPPVAGVRVASIEAGVRYSGRSDVMLAVMDPGTVVAGVFTQSATRAAPVLDCEAKIGAHTPDGAAILVNSGNANAFTGTRGVAAVTAITRQVARTTGIPEQRVFTASTGVIGEPLPADRITEKLGDLKKQLSPAGIAGAAEAIMTTDTFAKGASRVAEVDGQVVTVTGIAKGSGMIAPDMATMLVFIFTDAAIAQADLQAMVSRLNARTFNCITVDGDTSTSDTLLVSATGQSGVDVTGSAPFEDALHAVMRDLAHLVVRDGEGASKFVTVDITGAQDTADAREEGLELAHSTLVNTAIANSPLGKSAIAGVEPIGGRVGRAVGKSGAVADRDRLSIRFGDVLVADKGWVSPDYREEDAAAHMKGEEITIAVDLGLGDGTATIWTCDLTARYIEINADYRS